MKKRYICFVLIITLIAFFGCSDNPYKRRRNTRTWLHNVENYKKNKNYLTLFYQYYNTIIEEQKYEQATEVLDFVCI